MDAKTVERLQRILAIFGADAQNVFNPTIQGVARTDLDAALAQLAIYFAAGGAALSVVSSPGNAARTNLNDIFTDLANASNLIIEPTYGFIETWQGEPYINEMLWTPTNPLTGVAWAIAVSGATFRCGCTPALSEVARLACNLRYMMGAGALGYGTNTITRKILMEWTFKLTNLANINNATTFMGFTPNLTDVRTSNNIIGFCFLADVLQALTDNGSAETDTATPATITNVNKLKIEVYLGHVKFYLNEALVADHTTNLPVAPMYPMFYFAAEAGGTITPEFGSVRVWSETLVR